MERRRPGERGNDGRGDGRVYDGRGQDGRGYHGRGYDPRADPRQPVPANARRAVPALIPLVPFGPPPKPDLIPPPPKPERVPDPVAEPGTSNVKTEAEREANDRRERRARRRLDDLPRAPARKRARPQAEPAVAAGQIFRVVHVDDDLIVVDKAAGFPVAPAGAFRERSVVRALHGMGYPTVYPISLLDQEASGLVLLSRSDRAAHALRWNWRSNLCVRTYVAVAHGDIPGHKGKISIAIGAVRRGAAIRHEALPVENGGRSAVTEWKLLARGRGLTRVEVAIKQGRCHQIRIHFAAIGHPLFGDREYGRSFNDVPIEALIDVRGRSDEVPTLPQGQIALHCARIALPHPTTGAPMDWRSSVPRRLLALMPGAWTTAGAER